MTDYLFDELEELRIPESDFFGQSSEVQRCYERANQMLDDCLDILWKYFYKENKDERT